MSDSDRTAKPDAMLSHFLWGHDDFREGLGENGGLTGDEIDTYRVNDTGASMVADPVENFCKAVAANRLNTTPASTPPAGRVLEKRAGAVAHRVEQLGNWRLEYDASNKLIRAREIE